MKDLSEQDAVIRWPSHKPLPEPSELIDAGELGMGYVTETQVRYERGGYPPLQFVAIAIRPRIE